MSIPARAKDEYIKRLDELITEGNRIHDSIQEVVEAPFTSASATWVGVHRAGKTKRIYDREKFAAWKINCATLASALVPAGSPAAQLLNFVTVTPDKGTIKYAVGYLRGLQDNLGKGYLDELGLKIETEIASDYMVQAEALLREGRSGQYDHVPAAVLAGAVLEKALKTLCGRQSPPILLEDAKGKPKTLDPLITDLKNANVFNETKAKQLRAWAGIRNDAAHGDFNKFTKTDVEAMIKGIDVFLAEYLGQQRSLFLPSK